MALQPPLIPLRSVRSRLDHGHSLRLNGRLLDASVGIGAALLALLPVSESAASRGRFSLTAAGALLAVVVWPG